MRHFSDKTLDPDSGATEVSSEVSSEVSKETPERTGLGIFSEVVSEEVQDAFLDPEAALYATRRFHDLMKVVPADGDREEPCGEEVSLDKVGQEKAGLNTPRFSNDQEVVDASSPHPTASTSGHRSESEERRFRLGAWWQRVRPAEMSRPLQINELALAAEEHLRAAAVPTLENLYLPSRLMFRLSAADWGNLMPFDDYIEKEIGAVYQRLLHEPDFASLVERPEIKVLKGARLGEGDPPQVTSQFHQHLKEAKWRPGQQGVAVQPSPLKAGEVAAEKGLPEDRQEFGAAASMGLFEALATPGAEQATARQSVLLFCLQEALPLALVDARAKPQDRLRLDGEGCPVGADGQRWNGAPWEVLPPIAELPDLESPASTEMAEPPLLLIKPPGRSPVCWAPGGLVVVGRDPQRSNWVPSGAPTNLSGRHLAFAWIAAERALYALDLGSTNGAYLAGSRLVPLRPVRLELPVKLSIGTEGSLNLELYPAVVPGTAAQRPMLRPVGPQTQEELDDIPLR